VGCQTQNLGRGVIVSHAQERPKLTAKGERAQARIVAASAHLIHQRDVAGTTPEDVKAAADVSGSQLYH
jgi:TetR/AcrR family transcriptional regulator, transcriptional repressor for nem operon